MQGSISAKRPEKIIKPRQKSSNNTKNHHIKPKIIKTSQHIIKTTQKSLNQAKNHQNNTDTGSLQVIQKMIIKLKNYISKHDTLTHVTPNTTILYNIKNRQQTLKAKLDPGATNI